MIANGDFTSGDTNWVVDDGAGNLVDHTVDGGALCVMIDATTPFVSVRWPLESTTGAALTSGNSYVMTYDAWADDPAAVVLETKIAAANTPFTTQFAVDVELGSARESYLHGFNTRSTGTSGVVFELSLAQAQTRVCFDDVVLKAP
jgi:hypothetical protein